MRRRLLLVTVAALAACPATAGAAVYRYGGATTDGQPIVVHVNPATGSIERVILMFNARCDSGRRYSFGHRMNRRRGRLEPRAGRYDLYARTRAGRRFVGVGVALEGLADNRAAAVAATIRGSVRGNVVRGTLSAEVQVFGPDADEPEDTCRYRRVRWRAIRRPGVVLTGETSQHLPVVITLGAGARSVSRLRIGWNAGCEPAGFLQVPDHLVRFRILGGRFGASFDHTVRLPDGTERILRYDVDGAAGRRIATGTISVEMEDRGGPNPGTCRTGSVRWRAS